MSVLHKGYSGSRGLTGVGRAWKRSQEVWEYRVPGEGGGPVRPPLR